MATIVMCDNFKCKLHTSCWRINATRNAYNQVTAPFKPDKDGKCEDYIPMKGKADER